MIDDKQLVAQTKLFSIKSSSIVLLIAIEETINIYNIVIYYDYINYQNLLGVQGIKAYKTRTYLTISTFSILINIKMHPIGDNEL